MNPVEWLVCAAAFDVFWRSRRETRGCRHYEAAVAILRQNATAIFRRAPDFGEGSSGPSAPRAATGP